MNHRKNNRFPGLARAAASIEALEPRRLLAVTFNATAGDDNIAIGINGNAPQRYLVPNAAKTMVLQRLVHGDPRGWSASPPRFNCSQEAGLGANVKP